LIHPRNAKQPTFSLTVSFLCLRFRYDYDFEPWLFAPCHLVSDIATTQPQAM